MSSVVVSKIMTRDVVTHAIPGSSQYLLDSIINHRKSAFPVVKARTKELIGMISRADLLLNL